MVDMKWRMVMFPFFAPEDAGAGSGGQGTGQQGTSGEGASGAGQGTAGAQGTGQAGQQGQPTGQAGDGTTGQPRTGAQSGTGQQFDPKDWIPRHRFNEVSQRAQRAQALEQQLADAQRRIQALAGVAPQNPDDADAEQVRGAFGKMFPHLAKLDDAAVERIMRLAQNSEQIETTTQHYWKNVGQEMTGNLQKKVAENLGLSELSPRQSQRLAEFYINTLNRDHAIAVREGRQSDLVRRHEARDGKLIEELAKEFEEDFIEPVRRRATAQNVNRVNTRVPSGRPSQNVQNTTKKPIDFTNEKAVEDAAVEAFIANGGGFRR